MEEKITPLSEDKFQQLRTNMDKITIQSDLRRKLIGGISEEDVMKYVNSIRQQFQFIENELLNKIEKLKTSKDALGREFDSYRQKCEEEKTKMQETLENTLADLTDYMNQCKEKDALIKEMDEMFSSEVDRFDSEKSQLSSKCDELTDQVLLFKKEAEDLRASVSEFENMNMDMLKLRNTELEEAFKEIESKLEEEHSIRERVEQELRAKSVEVASKNEVHEARVEELEEQLCESRKMAEEYCAAYKEMEQQIKSEHENITRLLEEKANLNSKVIGFKEEIDAMYKQLNNLNEQISINDNLQQQLELERLRAGEAEKDMSQLLQHVSSLKDRFNKDQSQLEIQFIEIEEKHKSMQSDVNDLRTNLENFYVDTGTEIDGLYTTMKNKYEMFSTICVNQDEET